MRKFLNSTAKPRNLHAVKFSIKYLIKLMVDERFNELTFPSPKKVYCTSSRCIAYTFCRFISYNSNECSVFAYMYF